MIIPAIRVHRSCKFLDRWYAASIAWWGLHVVAEWHCSTALPSNKVFCVVTEEVHWFVFALQDPWTRFGRQNLVARRYGADSLPVCSACGGQLNAEDSWSACHLLGKHICFK